MTGLTGILTVIGVLLGLSNALTISQFENYTPGVFDAWQDADPQNVQGREFAMTIGDEDKIYLVSRRQFRPKGEQPWDSAARGGIVSIYQKSSPEWSHKPYDRLADDQYGEEIFSLGDRMFMLTYSTRPKRVEYHQLFFWYDGAGQWVRVPSEFDPLASTLTTNSIQRLSVNVPDQRGSSAYLVASTHANAQRGTEMAFSKLDVEFRGNVPIKARLNVLQRADGRDPSAVVFTAIRNDRLYALVQNFFSEGYVPVFDYVYVLDLTTKSINKVNLSGEYPPMHFDADRLFQLNSRGDVLMAGGTRAVGLGETVEVRSIWSLDLDALQWRSVQSDIPEHIGSVFAYDQRSSQLYAADLIAGISAASVSTSEEAPLALAAITGPVETSAATATAKSSTMMAAISSTTESFSEE